MKPLKFKTIEEVDVMSVSNPYVDLFDGGYLNPENFLDNDAQVEQVYAAMIVIKEYISGLQNNELIDIM